jgi:hypothetical protein
MGVFGMVPLQSRAALFQNFMVELLYSVVLIMFEKKGVTSS